MNVRAPFIADAESPKAIEPRPGALHHLAVAPEARRRLDANAGDATRHAMRVQEAPTMWFVVAFVRVHLPWLGARVATITEGPVERGNRIQHGLEHD